MNLFNQTDIEAALQIFHPPGSVFEIRVLDAATTCNRYEQTYSGYFDDPAKAASAIAGVNITKFSGAYWTLNPVNPKLLGRATNKLRPAGKNPTTGDADIVTRRWLLIDCDIQKPTGIAASDTEHEIARQRMNAVADYLFGLGWPAPIYAESGNGYHLLYRIDLPADDGGLLKSVLETVAHFHDDAAVKIDTGVFNPSRISRLYGAMNCKGDPDASTLDDPRPWRMAAILPRGDGPLDIVSREQLEQLATLMPATALITKSKASSTSGIGVFDLDVILANAPFELRGPEPYKDGRKWIIPVCPWNHEHTGGSAFVIQRGNGVIQAGCHHNSCKDKTWHDLRDILSPGWRERKVEDEQKSNSPSLLKTSETTRATSYHRPPWPEPLAEEAYHGLAGEFVRTVEPHTEADPVALLVQFLATFGNYIYRTAHFCAEASEHYCNLFVVLVGNTAKGRKGTSWGYVQRVFRQLDATWTDERIVNGLSSGEGLIFAVRDPVTQQDKNGNPKEKDPGVTDKRLLVLESEFASVLKAMARDKNTLSAVLRNAWDGQHILQTMVKNEPNKATDAHISIVGHITRTELTSLLTENDSANGVANRFIWVCSQRSKSLPEGGNLPASALNGIVQRLHDSLGFARETTIVHRDPVAKEIWASIYTQLSDGKPGLLGMVLARAEAQVMRLATIYALLDSSNMIRAEHLNAALALWQFSEQSALYIFGAATGNVLADRILTELVAVKPGGLTRTAINDSLGGHSKSQEISKALAELQEQNLVAISHEKQSTKTVEVWRAI